MKHIIVGLTLLLSIGISAQAQKKVVKKTSSKTTTKVVVPAVVKESFSSNYADVKNDKWSKSYVGNYVSTFSNAENIKQTNEYNANGQLLKTKIEFDSTTYPQIVTAALQQKYPTASIANVTKVQMPGLAPYYKVGIVIAETGRKRELFISEEGTISL